MFVLYLERQWYGGLYGAARLVAAKETEVQRMQRVQRARRASERAL